MPDDGLSSPARYARITNNFLHDMATGTWAACLLVLWMLSRRLPVMPEDAALALGEAMGAVFVLLLVALAVVVVTGIVRLRYWASQTADLDLSAKRRALAVKHVAFVLVYGAGTALAWSLLA